MEIMEIVKELGSAVKADARFTKMNEAIAAYNKDEELQKLVLEYNVQQTALGEEYKKENVDQAVIEAIEERLNALIEAITTSKIYVEAAEAQQAFDALMNEVYTELQFQITGQRPCTHDCSSCGSDCGHHHHHDDEE